MGMLPQPRKAETATETATKPSMPSPKTAPAPTQTAQPAATQETAAAPAPVAAAASVPAIQQGGAVATKVARKARNAIEDNFKEKVPLEWNTLPRVQANQGNFLDMENNKAAFGNEIVVQLMTYQPSWQLSPGTDNPDDLQYVRYSDDGVTTTKGEDIKQCLQALVDAGYDKAKISARYQMAFAIEETPGDSTGRMIGKLVQIDMAETSKKAFDGFMLQVSFMESRGMVTPEAAESGRLRLRAKVTSRGNFSWTVIEFNLA